jgi:hypothetical protein
MCFLSSVNSLIKATSNVLVSYLGSPEISITYWKTFDIRVGPGEEERTAGCRYITSGFVICTAANFVGLIKQ